MDHGRSLMVVVAHPDDDAYGMAGTVALHAADNGFRYVLVHATDGAAGDIRPDFPATRETLGAVRRAEDERAWRALGRRPDRHVWLGYDDGALDAVPIEELVDRIAALLVAERPDVVGTFGPDGITGHPDHVRVGAATDAAFDRVAAQAGKGLHRLVHGAMPQSVFERWNETRRRKGMTLWDPNVVYHLRGVPDEQIGISVDISSVAHQVVAGLREHRSQRHVIANPDVTDAQWARSTSVEHYVVARPRRHAGAPVLADVFDGLPTVQDESPREPPTWEPPLAGTEVEHLVGALDRLRTTFRWKADNLDAAGLQRQIGASSLTLGGLLKHLAIVEDFYFTTRLSGAPLGAPWDTTYRDDVTDWEFASAADDLPVDLYALWDGAVERSRERLAAALTGGGLDQLVHISGPDGRHASLRRLVCDLIEEYGRHTGHADLLREAVDGVVGEDPPDGWDA